MGITFNADEIFEMAEEIERNGAKFYREAAKKTRDNKTKKMLLDMAVMEDGHLKTFQEMRNELGADEKEPFIFDPGNEAAVYLQTMADSRGYEGKKSLTEKLSGKESIEDVLNIAVEAEKNSVVFYTGLKEMVPARAGKDKVTAIIKEELGHLATLKTSLAELRE
jgi:rubrerythrin